MSIKELLNHQNYYCKWMGEILDEYQEKYSVGELSSEEQQKVIQVAFQYFFILLSCIYEDDASIKKDLNVAIGFSGAMKRIVEKYGDSFIIQRDQIMKFIANIEKILPGVKLP